MGYCRVLMEGIAHDDLCGDDGLSRWELCGIS